MNLEHAVKLHQAGNYQEAARIYQGILAQNPNHPSALHWLGVLAFQTGGFEQSIQLIERALAIDDKQAAFHHNLASALRVVGKFEEAERRYRRAIELQPDYAEAYFNLAAVRRFSRPGDEKLCLAVEDQLRNPDLTDDNRSFLHYAAGKFYDDCGNYDAAFAHFVQGSQIRLNRFDVAAHESSVQRTMAVFTRSLFEQRSGCGDSSDVPIFIVGMPRSGTTLVEQIIESHPEARGAGELPDIPSIAHTLPQHHPENREYPECVLELPDRVFTGFAGAYLNRLCGPHPTAARIADKNPVNHQYLGLVALMLPRAVVIHCRRDPLDTCLSCFFQRFRAGQEFSYDFENLATMYGSYTRLMKHWHEHLPNKILDVQYEQLVDDTESVSRQLIQHCGLAWDDACLEFHKSKRPVTTASNQQVRQPIYRRSMARWKNYEKHLHPLKQALEKHLGDQDWQRL